MYLCGSGFAQSDDGKSVRAVYVIFLFYVASVTLLMIFSEFLSMQS